MKLDGNKYIEGNEVIYFKERDDLKNPENKLYCWVSSNDDQEWPWKAKVGEAIDEIVLDRVLKCTGSGAENRVVGLWKFDGGDKPIHDTLKRHAQFSPLFKHSNDGKQNGSLSESYYFKSLVGLNHILDIIDRTTGCKNQTKKDIPLYPDIGILLNQVIVDDYERVILDLCARWGKTRTALELMKLLSVKVGTNISVMLSYVRTAESSYVKEINKNIQYDNMAVIDPDKFASTNEVVSAIQNAKSIGKHVFYYLALTGKGDASDQFDNTCFNRRMKPLLKFKSEKMDFYVDEADYGAKTEKQTKKIQELIKKVNVVRLYLMTGTRACEVEAMWNGVSFHTYKRDYILDVLLSGTRKNAVGIEWHVLDNASLASVVGYTNCMENFSDMCEIVDGHLKGESYFRQLIKYLYQPDEPVFNPTKYRELSQARIVDSNFATMVFLPPKKEVHHKFAEMLEDMGFVAYVVNSDVTCNADAEANVTALLEENAIKMGLDGNNLWKRGKNVFIISGGMAKRSFSIAEIKNIMLLTNGGEYASVIQGVSRGLTPFLEDIAEAHQECKMCNIVDFRIQWNWSNLSSWLVGLGTNMLDDNNHMSSNDPFKVVTEIAHSTHKISFMEYTWNGINPIRHLTEEDMRVMMMCSLDFQKARLDKLATGLLPELPEPVRCELNESIDISLPCSGNAKGDSSKRRKKISLTQRGNENTGNVHVGNTTNDKNEHDKKTNPEWKIQHLNFIWNHKDWFFTIGYNNVYDSLNVMSEERKLLYEEMFGIDMNFMKLLVSSLKDNNFNLEFSQFI